MTESFPNTDRRLTAILGAGEGLLRRIDPEGLLGTGRLFRFAVNAENRSWKTMVVFPSGDILSVRGVSNAESVSVASVKTALPGGAWEAGATKPSEALCGALGDLSGTSVRLKRVLSPAGLETASGGRPPVSWETFVELTRNALFWDVEGADKKGIGERFPENEYKFNFELGGPVSSVELQTRCLLDEGEIIVRCDMNVFGLGNHKVILDKNLGMNRRALVDCRASRQGHPVPSLKVAFDLYDAIPVMYEKERRKKIKKGLPQKNK